MRKKNRQGAQTALKDNTETTTSKPNRAKNIDPIIPISNLDADVSESLEGLTIDASARLHNLSAFNHSTTSPAGRRINQKNKKSLQTSKEIVGNWSSNNYLDMDRIQRRKFIPNPCSDRRFELTHLPQVKIHG